MKWLCGSLMPLPIRMALFVDTGSYQKAFAKLEFVGSNEFVPGDANGCCHYFVHDKSGAETVFVCIDHEKVKSLTPIEIACQIVHEAVHVWQECAEWLGEKNLGREFEAYSIQRISEQLMKSYLEQTS